MSFPGRAGNALQLSPELLLGSCLAPQLSLAIFHEPTVEPESFLDPHLLRSETELSPTPMTVWSDALGCRKSR